MPSENVATGPIELQYTLTSADLLDGFAAQNRAIRRPWYLKWLSTMLMVGVVVVVSVSSVVSGDWTAGTAAAVAVLVVVMALFVVGLGVLLRRLFDVSRWMYRLQVRQLMRANPMMSQPMRVTVTDAEVRFESATVRSTVDWAQYPLHIETDQSFVLVGSARRGAAMLVLPKRGLAGSDPAPLLALIAAHSRRFS